MLLRTKRRRRPNGCSPGKEHITLLGVQRPLSVIASFYENSPHGDMIMKPFDGYVTTVIDPRKADRVVLTCDFLKKHNPGYEMDPYFPYNPLTAVRQTMDKLVEADGKLWTDFLEGHLIVNVIDTATGRVDTYNIDTVNYELELERIAG